MRKLLNECESLVRHSSEPEQKVRVTKLKGDVLIAEGKSLEALAVLSDAKKGLKINTDQASCLKSMAEVFELRGQHKKAMNTLIEAMNLVPEGPDKTEIKLMMKQVKKGPKF